MRWASRSGSISAAVSIWLSLAIIPAFALDPKEPFSGYIRTHFTTDDGLPASVVDDIQQTADGFLWLVVNGNGLVRFDGRRFQLIEGIRPKVIVAAPDGDLWLGTNKGLTRMPSDSLRHFDLSDAISYQPGPGSAADIQCLRLGRKGVLWVGTAAGLFRFDNGRFSPVGPRVRILGIEQAATEHLLLVTAEGFVELDAPDVVPLPGLAAQLGARIDEIFHVMQDSQGNVWYCNSQGVARRSGARWLKLPPYGPKGHGAFRSYEDAQGTVWIVKTEGLFRATPAGLDLAVAGMQVRTLYADRDGSLWVGTNGDGLYRLKDRVARMFTTADGLPSNVIMSVIVAHDGSIWTGANCGGITRFDGAHFQTFNEKDGLLNSCVWALAEDANHDLWIGTWGGGAFRLHDGRFTQALAGEIVTSILAARDGSVWFATRHGAARLRNGSFRSYATAGGVKNDATSTIFEDRAGRILTGNWGGIDVLVGDRFESLSQVPKGKALPMGEDRSGGLFIDVDGERFALRIQGGRVDVVPELHQETGLIETGSGELWFGGAGIHRVPPDSFARPRARDEPLDDEWFGTPDGLATTEVSAGDPNMALAGDGTLWIATPLGLAAFDPRHFPSRAHPPTIYIREVTVGRETRPAARQLVLRPGTSHVEVDFAAVEISSPEKIRMQYRLDGVDSEWLDAGSNPRAIYSIIPAGTHALHVRACNRNGIWDRAGMVYLIRQQPHYYQTRWFLALTIATGVLLIGGAYRLRLRRVSRQLSARFDERLAERTRVARDLHDTFLQTVQGSKLVADHALKDPDDHARLLHAVEQLATWLERASEEGRAALLSLRTSAAERNDLAEAFQRAIDECRSNADLDATISVTGNARDVHPILRDEVYRIGLEAIRNACTHSRADVLRVELEHAHDLTLRVSDNGVGLDPAFLEKGKEGHFGLRGMRERAERIGGRLTIASSPSSGTTITLVVPGRLAYRTRGPGRSQRITSVVPPD